ncbi:MAG: glycosyltransferase 87 family protein [Chloroflexota bacterium]|nr:glycosyltransferase 87 family protein [Chloroflexota bacterium]
MRRVFGVAGLALAAVILLAIGWAAEPFLPDSLGPGHDARAYWVVTLDDPYAFGLVGEESAFPYSPAFLQTLTPIRALDWTPFLVVWTGLLMAALLVMVGPLLFAPMVALTAIDLWGGNIHLLLALAIVAGFRWPAAWAFMLLSKVTPGMGLLWFAARGEWRALGVAAATAAVIAAVSVAVAPHIWVDWFRFLEGSAGRSTVGHSLPVPLWVRLPLAAGVVLMAARTDRRWLLPVGVLLALPVIWWGSFSILAASVGLERRRIEAWLLAHVTRRAPGPSEENPVRAGPER